MSPNRTIKRIRIQKNISQAEIAYKLGCSIAEINEIETEGFPITGELFLRLLAIYSTNIEDIIKVDSDKNEV